MGRSVVQTCANGHDIAVVGRYRSDRGKYGPCKECNRLASHKLTAAKVLFVREFKLAAGCIRCGYCKSHWALDLHHRDPGTKSFGFGESTRRSWASLRAEIKKCDVICRNCHAELHEEESNGG